MDKRYSYYWSSIWSRQLFRRSLVLSVLLHVLVAVLVMQLYRWQTIPRMPLVYHVQLMPVVEAKAKPVETPKPPPKVEPEKPKPKPEPEKPKPKPAPEKPKPEPEKPKPEAKKPEPEKPKPEPEKPKEEPKTEVAKNEEPTSKIQTTEELPPELNSWGRLVQRKVERFWAEPGGVRLDADEMTAEVMFVVDRNGNLMEDPIVIKPASDPRLGESGVRAIKLAAPLPPLPDGFGPMEQRVVYGFTLQK